ncbi:hypothetical protein [Rhodovarius sp.]|uniref:hypothetical protein n=1 Tax=Rhodovarius sp. TaxID=2972673 RepID=UPI00334158F9
MQLSSATKANSAVKCAFSSLGCSAALRQAVDDLAVRMQLVAVRGTHLANHLLAGVLNASPGPGPLAAIPDVFDCSWWQQCFKAAANPRSGKPGPLCEASRRLFADGQVVRMGSAGTHAVETLAQDIRTNLQVMLILNFHKQLRKAFRRDVLCWTAARDFELETRDREKMVDYCVWRCVQQGSRFQEVTFPLEDCEPAELRSDLQAELDEEVERWRARYGDLVGCPAPAFVSNLKYPQLLRLFCWFVDLQRQRRDRLQELTQVFGGDGEKARKALGAAAKAMRPLPLCKLRVGHVAVDRTTLKSLLLELRAAGHPVSDLEIPLLTAVEVPRDENGEPVRKKPRKHADGNDKKTRNRRIGADDARETELFWSHFPKAKRLLRGRAGAALCPFIRTDGISCSVAVHLPGRPSTKEEVKVLKSFENSCDLSPGNPRPLIRRNDQRLVSVDPGRRDMVYCCVKAGSEVSPTTSFFKVSTRQHVKEAKRRRVAGVTEALQKRTILSAEEYREHDRHPDLHSALVHMPSSKAFETYGAYEAAMLPILEEAVTAMGARRLRREALLSFMSKDKALDKICHQICGGVAITKAQKRGGQARVLVAFGNGGKVSTTGCGYAPAPQARLRHRLQHVWGAQVSLINEYRTSKCCSKCVQETQLCGQVMGMVYKRRNKGQVLKRPVKIHGVLRCPDREHGFCHRDRNAAVNIMAIYEALAAENPRPKHLVPKGRFA